ncbi:hypothetical protein ACFSLT_25760 [Novosphingobium resinovorum]
MAEPAFAVPGHARAVLQAAEAAGFDLLMLGRSGERPFDAQVLVAWAAPMTSTLGVVATVPASKAHPSTSPARCRQWTFSPPGAPAGRSSPKARPRAWPKTWSAPPARCGTAGAATR